VIELYSPRDEGELVFLCSLLDAGGIEYFVRNNQLGMLAAFSQEFLHPAKTILVDEGAAKSAGEIIQEYLDGRAED
jgi:hypothetical protein